MSVTINTYLIPLSAAPQLFNILLAGITYTLTVKWNDPGQSWFLDIGDSSNNPLACGLPLVTGESLLDGLEYLGIAGDLVIITNGQMPDSVPTLTNLGSDSNLYFQTSSPNE